MPKLLLATLLILSALTPSALFAQVEPPKKDTKKDAGVAEDADTNKKTSKLKTWPDKEAKVAIKEFNAVFKKKKPSLRDQLQALKKLEEGRSPLLVKPLVKAIKKTKRDTVRKQAAKLLGNQPKKPTRKNILKLIKDKKLQQYPVLQAELIHAFAKECYESKDWQLFDRRFRRMRDNPVEANRPWEKAIVELVIKTKEKQALRTMLQSMDPPAPANVDDPSNPPAEYWKRRWHNWAVWKREAKDAVKQITGQSFNNSKEAKAWLAKNARKLGLKY